LFNYINSTIVKYFMEKLYYSNYSTYKKVLCLKKNGGLIRPAKAALMVIIILLTVSGLHAQVSGSWDTDNILGTPGYANKGNGVIQLTDNASNGKVGSNVSETSAQYDPSLGDFSKCYQVFFGCPPANDNIGGPDQGGDGMAFSFSKCVPTLVANSGGGGLGYMNACASNKMITLEFDTYSSQCNSSFDCFYGGGTSGNNDEISLHKDGDASDAGLVTNTASTNTNAGNLEDGMEHTVCISYAHATHVLSVTIDGVSKFSYDLTGSPYELVTYFGAGGLNQTWSGGKQGATEYMMVNDGDGTSIFTQLGGSPCPSGVVITSPSNGATYGSCPIAPITIDVTATPAAGCTATSVDFIVDGSTIGTDNSFPFSFTWSSPTLGSHAITATAHFSGGCANVTSSATNVTVGSGLNKTSTAPTIDGTAEALWSSYPPVSLTQGFNSPPNLAATYQTMYDATNLYIFVNVTDQTLENNGGLNWQKDGVEIYIDYGNTKTGCCSYNANDFQYTFPYNDGSAYETYHSPASIAGVTVGQAITAGGYTKEIKIPWASIGGAAPAAGTNLGFDVSINDNDNAGTTRDHQLSWNDPTFGEWQNPSLFGTLAVTNCNPLPVELLTFTGKMINGTVVLNWTTVMERNNQKFIIERSSNSSDWEAIGEVAGAGNVTTLTNYSFIDYTPLDGTSYYRLRQVDIDGAFAYSNVALLQTAGDQSVSISPNPFDDALFIKTTIQGEMNISIYDVLGRLMFHVNQKSDNDGTLRILQPELVSGTYVVTVQAGEFVERQKVIKK
jgi:hypothetical protein